MRKRLALVAVMLAVLVACPATAPARLIDDWPYDKLFKAADLIVFATAVKTEAADDKPPEHPWNYELVAQNTTFKVKHSLKGKPGDESLKVLHFKFGELKKGFRLGTADAFIENPPLLVAFRTRAVIVKAKGDERSAVLPTPEYLLFLTRMKDGRYEPVSGRIDPALSVREVSAPPDEVLGGNK